MKNYLIKLSIIVKTFSLLAFLVLITRCDSKKSTGTGAVSSTLSSIYTNVLSRNCVQCHEPGASATVNNSTQVDFSSPSSAYQTLTSLTSTGISTGSQCSNVPLVSIGHPEQSYLLATLSSDYFHTDFYQNGCTPYSPDAHGATLSSTELHAIVEWIQNGASNN